MSRRSRPESPSFRVNMSVFTAIRFSTGDRLEEAIGCVTELAANYIAARQRTATSCTPVAI